MLINNLPAAMDPVGLLPCSFLTAYANCFSDVGWDVGLDLEAGCVGSGRLRLVEDVGERETADWDIMLAVAESVAVEEL